MMVVIIEFELRAGAEVAYETALKHMQEQVRQYDGFLGEMPCCSIENEKTWAASLILIEIVHVWIECGLEGYIAESGAADSKNDEIFASRF